MRKHSNSTRLLSTLPCPFLGAMSTDQLLIFERPKKRRHTGEIRDIDCYLKNTILFSSIQSLSRVRRFATPWIAAHQASLSITSSWSLLKLMPIESVMPSSHLILCRPLLLLPPIPPSIRVFSNESPLRVRWPKYWSFSFSISPSNEHPGLISFRMDWLDLLAVQGTLNSLLQTYSFKEPQTLKIHHSMLQQLVTTQNV